MSLETIYKCDICGGSTGWPSGWFLAADVHEGVTFRHWNYDGDKESYAHLCGEKCCQTLLSRFLSQKSTQPTFEVTA